MGGNESGGVDTGVSRRGRTARAAPASTCSPASTMSLRRLGLDCVDIFYSRRFDPETPLVGCIVFSPLAQGLLTDRYLQAAS